MFTMLAIFNVISSKLIVRNDSSHFPCYSVSINIKISPENVDEPNLGLRGVHLLSDIVH